MTDEIKIPIDVMEKAISALDATSMSGVPAREAFAGVIARWMREECAKVVDDEESICNCGDTTLKEIAASVRRVGTSKETPSVTR